VCISHIMNCFFSDISEYSVGDTITIRVSREGKQSDVNLTLREYIPEEVKNKFN
jgi:predicted RNA-binding protein with RPS1 domain